MCLALASPSHVKHYNIVSQKVQIIPQRLIACNRFFIKLGLHRVYLNYVGMLIYIPFTNFSEDGSASQRAEPKYDSCGIAIPPPSHAAPFPYFLRTARQNKRQYLSTPTAGLPPLTAHCTFSFFSEDGSASQRAEPKYDSRGIAIPPPSHLGSALYRLASPTILVHSSTLQNRQPSTALVLLPA